MNKITNSDLFKKYKRLFIGLISVIAIVLVITLGKVYQEKKSFSRIKGLEMSVVELAGGNFSSVQGNWISLETTSYSGDSYLEEGKSELLINTKGKLRVLEEEGNLVVVEKGNGYLIANARTTHNDVDYGLYANGKSLDEKKAGRVSYNEGIKSIYFFKAGTSFSSKSELEELGFNGKYDLMVPLSFEKDTIVFQTNADEYTEWENGWRFNPSLTEYYVYQRPDEIEKVEQEVEESVLDLEAIYDKDFATISGSWTSTDGFRLTIDENQKTNISNSYLFPWEEGEGIILGGHGYYKNDYPEGRHIYLDGTGTEKGDYLGYNEPNFMLIKAGTRLNQLWELVGNIDSVVEELSDDNSIIPAMRKVSKDVLIMANSVPPRYDDGVAKARYTNMTYSVFYHEVNSNDEIGMQVDELEEGDFSSVAGLWIPAKGDGNSFSIDNNGYLYWNNSSTGTLITDVVAEYQYTTYAWGALGEQYSRQSDSGRHITFIPELFTAFESVTTDRYRDRIILGDKSKAKLEQVYYREGMRE